MSEVPHCPECKRADKVKVKNGSGYEYYCRNCERTIKTDDIVDGPFIDMVSDSMFKNPKKVKQNSEFDFNEQCTCGYCERGRPGLEEIKESLKEDINS